VGIAAFVRARDRLLGLGEQQVSSSEVCGVIARAVQEVAPFDACAVMTTDTDTLLPSGGVVEGFPPTYCAPFWDNELLDPDFNKFCDLARSVDPVATLVEAVDGDLDRCQRYRKLYAEFDAVDELRCAFVAGTSCLAVGVFVRSRPAGEFTPEEVADVRRLVPVATAGLRRALGQLCRGAGQPPVVVVLDGDGRVTTMTEGSQQVLDDLRTPGVDDGALPEVIRAAATRARWSRTATNLTTRVQGRSGQWLRVHVAPVEGSVGPVVLTLEPARPDDLVQILLESYGLTERETEIVLLLARGLSVKEIAAELSISGHTVRDHVKAIYDKAGVSTRGELVAGLFANHVLDRFHDSVAHLT
jgi:DNA-binding CsgD family transcriptional regulator